MDFIEELDNLSAKITREKDSIEDEATTKTAFVMPFINLLGYSVSNPTEVKPEFTADHGTKQGEKVDYAIFKDDEVIMLIECKKYGEDLSDAHTSQLYRYFSVVPARIAVLTDGVLYRFYTDLEETHKMDTKPFLEFDMLDIQPPLVNELKRFTKPAFDLEAALTAASDLKYTKEIKQIMREQLEAPSEDFVKFFLSSVYSGSKTQAIVQQFTGIIKQALKEFIDEQSRQHKPDEKLPVEPDNSTKQLTNDKNNNQNPQGTRQRRLIFDNEECKLGTLKACLIECCEILSERYGEAFEKAALTNQLKLPKQQRHNFSKNPKDLRKHHRIKDFYVETNFGTDLAQRLVKKFAEHFGHEASIE